MSQQSIECLEINFDIEESHQLALSHIEAMKRQLVKGNVEDALYHLNVAKVLLRPTSHRHSEVAEMIEVLSAEPLKVTAELSEHLPELNMAEAAESLAALLETVTEHQSQIVRPVYADGNYWELELFFSSPTAMRYVSVTHAASGSTYPLLYQVTDYYSRVATVHPSFKAVSERLTYLISE